MSDKIIREEILKVMQNTLKMFDAKQIVLNKVDAFLLGSDYIYGLEVVIDNTIPRGEFVIKP